MKIYIRCESDGYNGAIPTMAFLEKEKGIDWLKEQFNLTAIEAIHDFDFWFHTLEIPVDNLK